MGREDCPLVESFEQDGPVCCSTPLNLASADLCQSPLRASEGADKLRALPMQGATTRVTGMLQKEKAMQGEQDEQEDQDQQDEQEEVDEDRVDNK
eukprot:CAMPEP_0206434822 /NCGR_PEP_ID=MMETSP0324_2-20121206/9434_1 /ASSEMBLY_ACC=CAM_ASM_000836 /TAXON_ID=2866 /ORGANISM="Crypthecodinium cohnii, Strain Seligo" /LENGTH=94 /DNA_ID=CAMNT_0053901505 /DNA_START=98 /DNA_END=382 /DNA_ORIENTATION=+